ncbi:polyisoprenoid-binding protein YceI [Flavobacterium sp. W4I14]|nr:polyisoprenoid-binding protein YceI [Flavobacterium sp. W4I14]
MKREINFMLLLGVLGLANIGFNIFTNWNIKQDNHSIEIIGTEIQEAFSCLKAKLNFDPAHPEQGNLSAPIDARSLSTDFFPKTRHALSKEALDVEKYPTIVFRSDAITKNGDLHEASGKLTVNDVTKRIIISFAFNGTDISRAFKGSFKIRPKEYHLTCKKTPEKIPLELLILEPVLNPHMFSNDLAELATMNGFLDNTDRGRHLSEIQRKLYRSRDY